MTKNALVAIEPISNFQSKVSEIVDKFFYSKFLIESNIDFDIENTTKENISFIISCYSVSFVKYLNNKTKYKLEKNKIPILIPVKYVFNNDIELKNYIEELLLEKTQHFSKREINVTEFFNNLESYKSLIKLTENKTKDILNNFITDNFSNIKDKLSVYVSDVSMFSDSILISTTIKSEGCNNFSGFLHTEEIEIASENVDDYMNEKLDLFDYEKRLIEQLYLDNIKDKINNYFDYKAWKDAKNQVEEKYDAAI